MRTTRSLYPGRLAAALVFVLCLTACAGTPSGIVAAADGADVSVSPPPQKTDVAAAALAAAENLPVGDYLMLRPSDISTDGTIPATGVTLNVVLPAELPAGVVGSFVSFDEGTGTWVPVPTTVTGRDAVATVNHLSLWSFVVRGTAESISAIRTAFESSGEAVVDSLAWWSTEGPGNWIYRQGGLLLGLAVEAPSCEPGALPGWVDQAVISALTGRSAENQSVLRCVGVDPADKDRLQIKAAANRAYGFGLSLADGVTPREMLWSHLEGILSGDVQILADAFADGAISAAFLDPRDYLIGTTEVSFSVTQQDVLAIPEGEHLVVFDTLPPEQMALSIVSKMALSAVEHSAAGLLAAALALRNCEFGEFAETDEAAVWAGVVVACLQAVGDEDFLRGVDELAEKARRVDATPNTDSLLSQDGRKALRTAFSALKWIDVVTLALAFIDYQGERLDDTMYIDITAVPRPAWEDIDGVWCPTGGGECTTITVPKATYAGFSSTMSFGAMLGNCFQGLQSPDDGSGGANVLYCPAGTPAPNSDFSGDDPTRDRVWFYQGPGELPQWRR